MRNIITFFLVMFAGAIYAQTVVPSGNANQVTDFKGGVKVEKTFSIPVTDADNFPGLDKLGQIRISPTDSIMRYFNGTEWKEINKVQSKSNKGLAGLAVIKQSPRLFVRDDEGESNIIVSRDSININTTYLKIKDVADVSVEGVYKYFFRDITSYLGVTWYNGTQVNHLGELILIDDGSGLSIFDLMSPEGTIIARFDVDGLTKDIVMNIKQYDNLTMYGNNFAADFIFGSSIKLIGFVEEVHIAPNINIASRDFVVTRKKTNATGSMGSLAFTDSGFSIGMGMSDGGGSGFSVNNNLSWGGSGYVSFSPSGGQFQLGNNQGIISSGSGGQVMFDPSNGISIGGNAGGVTLNGSSKGVHAFGGGGGIDFHAQGGDITLSGTNTSGIVIKDEGSGGFEGARYDQDYSANYTDRSLVDKAFVLSQTGAQTTLQQVLDQEATAATDSVVAIHSSGFRLDGRSGGQIIMDTISGLGIYGANKGVRIEGQGAPVTLAGGGFSGKTVITNGGLDVTSGTFSAVNQAFLPAVYPSRAYGNPGSFNYFNLQDGSNNCNWYLAGDNDFNMYGGSDSYFSLSVKSNFYQPSNFYAPSTYYSLPALNSYSTPYNDLQLVPKKYVDDAIASVGGGGPIGPTLNATVTQSNIVTNQNINFYENISGSSFRTFLNNTYGMFVLLSDQNSASLTKGIGFHYREEDGLNGFYLQMSNSNGIDGRLKKEYLTANRIWNLRDRSGDIAFTDEITGLQKITDAGTGWRLAGTNLANFGNLGPNAVDFSFSNTAGTTNGASGDTAFATGFNTTASGQYSSTSGKYATASAESSRAEGAYTTASGTYGHAEGYGATASNQAAHAEGGTTTASGMYSHAEGVNNFARSYGEHAGGSYGTDYTPASTTAVVAADRLISYGNGNATTRSDAFILLKSGLLRLPSVTNTLIAAGDGKSVVTKEWVQNYNAKTANYTLSATDDVIAFTGTTTATATLPTAVGIGGEKFYIMNTGTGTITMATTAAQTIGGNAASAYTLTQGTTLAVTSDGANWRIINYYSPLAAASFVATTSAYTTGTAKTITANGTYTITLATTGIPDGSEYVIKNIGTGTITVVVSGGGTIDGAASKIFTVQNTGAKFTKTGSNYIITGNF